jgi:hypothetical protein
MLLVFELPLFAMAAVTTTLVQVAASLLVIWFVVVAGVFAGILARGGASPVFAASGIQWMTPAFWFLLATVGRFPVIIPLQYVRTGDPAIPPDRSRRRLRRPHADLSTMGFGVLGSSAGYRRMAAAAFPYCELRSTEFRGQRGRRAIGYRRIPCILPLHVSGLPPDSIVMNESCRGASSRSRRRNDLSRFERHPRWGTGDDFVVRTAAGGDVHLHQRDRVARRRLCASPPASGASGESTTPHALSTRASAIVGADKRRPAIEDAWLV